MEAPWAGERRSPHRLRTGQPTYSILNQAIERELLPVARRSGMAVSVRSPLAMGLLTGRYRKNDALIGNIRMRWVPGRPSNPRKLDAVEQPIPLAEQAGRSPTWPWPSPPPT
ncbi:aldo/keto reductase [Streptomyces sp. NPDC059278]|uniref:aldo/keto reductase n=1 Tax=Streptomyces sp. NPDC059278 TaxID=3346801 RepID=UPI0036C7CED4